MFLYDKKEKSLDVYSFNDDKPDIIGYRMNQMFKIPERERVVVAKSFSYDDNDTPLFERYQKQFDTIVIPMILANEKENELRYHLLKTVGITSRRNREILLDSYYFWHLSDRKIARIQDLDRLRYFLLTTTKYTRESWEPRVKILKDIIELQESLYILQMLEQEKFSLLGDKDISKQLDLFKISHINQISLEELKKVDACGMTINTYEQVLAKADNDAHVLKLIIKRNMI